MNLNDLYIIIGKRIKLRRKELGMKQSELAEKLNVSNNHISSIENAREKPSLDTFIKICIELKITPDYLVLGNIHANDVPQNIIDGLRLCSDEDLKLAREFIEILIRRNSDTWNNNNFI